VANWIAVALVCLVCTVRVPVRPSMHVRSTNRQMLELLDVGWRRSAIFRSMVEALERSNVIVYVEPSTEMSGGGLRFAAGPAQARYLRVLVNPAKDTDQLLALIAHELQHGVEVAQATDVVDDFSFVASFARIGRSHCGERRRCYETIAAVDIGARTYRELCGRSVPEEGLACQIRR